MTTDQHEPDIVDRIDQALGAPAADPAPRLPDPEPVPAELLTYADKVAAADARIPAPAAPVRDIAIINSIPVRRWYMIRRRMDLAAADILQDAVLIALVAAVETNLRETGHDEWDRFEAMTFPALLEYLGVDEDTVQDAAKSRAG